MMETLKELIPTWALILGVMLVALGAQPLMTFVPGVLLYVAGFLLIYFWETSPWSMHRDLHRVCRRLGMRRVDFIYDASTEQVMVVVLTKDGEVRENISVGVEDAPSKEETPH